MFIRFPKKEYKKRNLQKKPEVIKKDRNLKTEDLGRKEIKRIQRPAAYSEKNTWKE